MNSTYPARRPKSRKRGETPPFVWLEKSMLLDCENWANLTPAAKLLYICIKTRYNAHNNGKIKLSYSELKGIKGLSSPSTISKARKELVEKGWIKVKEIGGLYRHYNLYELSWKYDSLD